MAAGRAVCQTGNFIDTVLGLYVEYLLSGTFVYHDDLHTWLVCSAPDQMDWVQALAVAIVWCS